MDIKIKINTDNQAFAFDELQEVKRILQDNINDIKSNDLVYLYDINGNTVGTIERVEVWSYTIQNIKLIIKNIY